MPDILQLLQSLGLSVETIARISAWWVTLQLVCKLAETHLQRGLTWLTDRIDDFAGAKEDGQVLLRLVEHRAYRVLAWVARFLFRVILPNRASIEARWARIEKEKENEAEKEKGPNCFTPMLALSAMSAVTGVMLLMGCASPSGTQQRLDPVEVGYIVEDAAFVGTRVALMKNPESRPAFEDAVAALALLENDPEISLGKIRDIAATLHVRELESEKATLLITGADLLLTRMDRGSIDLRKVDWLPPVVAGFRRGIDRALKL